ncbi:MAG: hypothetical protein ABSG68_04735 [Thermoguttaceae bacterium]|jgi:hypothetical protein
MEPSSRTPEGWPNRCPVCGKDVCIEPSTPPGDAPCPHCGHLLWFDPSIREGAEARRGRRLELCFQHAAKQISQGNYDYAADLLTECVLNDPGNLIYVRSFVSNLQKKFGNNKKGRVYAKFMELKARRAVQEAISQRQWHEVIKKSLVILKVNPWDVSTLTAMATAYKNIASEGGPAFSRFADCSRFYLECAADAGH